MADSLNDVSDKDLLIAELRSLLKEAVELLSYTGRMHDSFLLRALPQIHWEPGEKPPYIRDAGRYGAIIARSKKSKLGPNGTPRPIDDVECPEELTEVEVIEDEH